MHSPKRKRLAAAAVATLAATALVGGTLAQFTDSDTTEAQTLTAGVVNIDLVEDANWSQNLDKLAIGDTATRSVLLDNKSSLAIGSLSLSADLTDSVGEFGGRLSQAVTVDIVQNPRADQAVLAQDVLLEDLEAGYPLVFPEGGLQPGIDVPLAFSYEVVGAPSDHAGDRSKHRRETAENPDNKYQGSALTVKYTLDAIQRPGRAQAGASTGNGDTGSGGSGDSGSTPPAGTAALNGASFGDNPATYSVTGDPATALSDGADSSYVDLAANGTWHNVPLASDAAADAKIMGASAIKISLRGEVLDANGNAIAPSNLADATVKWTMRDGDSTGYVSDWATLSGEHWNADDSTEMKSGIVDFTFSITPEYLQAVNGEGGYNYNYSNVEEGLTFQQFKEAMANDGWFELYANRGGRDSGPLATVRLYEFKVTAVN